MTENSYQTIQALLESSRIEELREGLRRIREEIGRAGAGESRQLLEMLSTLFYIDTLDHPELVPVLDEAIDLAVDFGTWAIPVLLDNLNAGDIKAQWAIAHVLGRFGEESIDPMMQKYASSADPTVRAFLIYALGKIKSPKVVEAAPAAVEAARSSNRELRDTATRTIGKLAESVPPGRLPEALKRQFLDCLHANLSDANATLRAKAVRSLGKMAKYGHMSEEERARLRSILLSLLGADDSHEWDRAYIVRKEAKEAMAHL